MSNPNLIRQIEFYLSDENLQNDEFFYKEVAANKEHFVSIKAFLNCNKIKKMGITKVEQVVQGIAECETLQLNKDSTMIRRKNLDDLPEFKLKKKVKTEEKPKENDNPYEKLEVVIYSLGVEKEQIVPFRYVQEALLKNHNIYSPYVRFNKTEGNFAINKKQYNEAECEKLVKEGLKVGEALLTVSKSEGAKLDEFWEKHGHHYNGIIDSLKKDFNKKAREEKRTQSRSKKVSFDFGGETYEDINKLKSLFKNILCRNPNNIPLKESEFKLVKELLAFHDHGEEKLKNLKHFVVDVHPNYVDTRCLFAVKEDGSREDFSIVKCVHNIEEKYAA